MAVALFAALNPPKAESNNRWDNLENTPYNSMERLNKMGQGKHLIRHDFRSPPLNRMRTTWNGARQW